MPTGCGPRPCAATAATPRRAHGRARAVKAGRYRLLYVKATGNDPAAPRA